MCYVIKTMLFSIYTSTESEKKMYWKKCYKQMHMKGT